MASKQEEEELAFSAAYEDDTPTPPGWKRKLVPRIGKGLIPWRTDVIFITPHGEEFTSRAQLQRYLKANKGSPSISEFIWVVDESPQRTTRSKSTPLVEVTKVELPLKIASKRKSATEVPVKEEPNKHRRTGKTQKSVEELVVVEDKRTKAVAHTATPTMGESEGKAFVGSCNPVSPKRKRSMKKRSRVPAAVGTKSVEINGESDLSKKDEIADEAVEKLTPSKKNPAKARTVRGARRKGTKMDDTKKEAEGENGIDKSSPLEDVTKAESGAHVGDEDNVQAEKDSSEVMAQDNEKESIIDHDNHHHSESTAA